MKKIIIAIDGHSSTGKSTFAKMIASKLGFTFIDSGAMYRAVTLFAIEEGYIDNGDNIDTDRLKAALGRIEITCLNYPDGSSVTFLNDRNVEPDIRGLKVSSLVSPVSALPFVRDYVNILLRYYGTQDNSVVDGRDIGTVVFPDAPLKIFMTADASIRAKRRFDQMESKGEKADYEKIYKNVVERDYIDSYRAVAPLCKADDALVLDNSNMTVEDQLVWVDEIVQKRFGLKLS
ncbi:MAG: (d)CMP kinase [Bacteroidales bacterium]|nr:(d)CMP kinase [Bacteroidales bacterium]MDD4669625.1 (d)CMP kinase [Bacteroidales bacterium]